MGKIELKAPLILFFGIGEIIHTWILCVMMIPILLYAMIQILPFAIILGTSLYNIIYDYWYQFILILFGYMLTYLRIG